jgi:hypothetical protein
MSHTTLSDAVYSLIDWVKPDLVNPTGDAETDETMAELSSKITALESHLDNNAEHYSTVFID